ncbi:hypothetical protein VNO77_39939 [Canavalia gladiata]|uniref:Uncharacterized protein n=1 Tax=Canavalia gladiata TaxID=3824 RepID=A0AAN9JX29_CANGL
MLKVLSLPQLQWFPGERFHILLETILKEEAAAESIRTPYQNSQNGMANVGIDPVESLTLASDTNFPWIYCR